MKFNTVIRRIAATLALMYVTLVGITAATLAVLMDGVAMIWTSDVACINLETIASDIAQVADKIVAWGMQE